LSARRAGRILPAGDGAFSRKKVHGVAETRTFRIAVIPGDGIGAEVVPEGLRVLDRLAALSGGRLAFAYESFPWGCQHYLRTGRMMDADGLERLAGFDAIYFGAVGWPGVPDHVSLWGLRLAICQGFDQYACIRPVRLLPGVPSPLKSATAETVDWVVVRENSEGEYAGIGGRNLAGRGADREVAIQTALFTAQGCERIIRYAFDLARTRRRRKVTGVTKSNAQQYAMTLWDETFARVAAAYPDVETEQWLVDAMAARFVLRPETLEVVVASNLFGDILSDLGSAIGGSLGIAASANLDPERRHPSMFEPVHGSAPDIAGQGIANPVAAIWTVALMLDHLGLTAEAALVMDAVAATTGAGVLTPDLGGSATTREVGEAIAAALGSR
jgi:tartrate dehydrogenase/decarboxylase/D-malate dehydrogenase